MHSKLNQAVKYLGQEHVGAQMELEVVFDIISAVTSFAPVHLGSVCGRL